jgi:hypothetical protein
MEELKKLPGVIDVKQEKGYKNGQYIVYYGMPLDHKDPSKGTFTQRMYVYYKGKDAPNLFYCGGYELAFAIGGYLLSSGDEITLTTLDRDEEECAFSAKYNCNFFEPEFRLYEPGLKEMHYTNLEYRNYLTDENASEDFHFMIEGLKTLLSGKWAFEGMSKGGNFTAYQLGRHPEDADLFVVECAPLKECKNYPGLYEYAYTTAGDDRYGKETAKKYRELLLELQVELIKHKEAVKKIYFTPDIVGHEREVPVFSSDFDEDLIYDCAVLDLVYCWQYAFDSYFDDVEKLLKMKDATDPDAIREYEDALGMHLSTYYMCWQYAIAVENSNPVLQALHSSMSNFIFQEYREDGNYLYDFSYLREALEKDGSGAKLSITEDMEEGLFDLRVYEEYRKIFKYDPTACDIRVRAIETAEKPVIIVNGTTDVHHIAEIMESDNPNVHVFNIIGACHDESDCAYLFTDEEVPYKPLTSKERNEYDSVVKKALGIR